MIAGLLVAMKRVLKHENWTIEENLFRFDHFNGMPHVFERVVVIPIKANDRINVDHVCILPTYTHMINSC